MKECNNNNKNNWPHIDYINQNEYMRDVDKHCFQILLLAPEYSMDIQGKLSTALCTLHNFIWTHDPDDEIEMQDCDIGINIVDKDHDVPGPRPAVELGEEQVKTRQLL